MPLMFWRGFWYATTSDQLRIHAMADYAAGDPLPNIVLVSIAFVITMLGGFELLVLIGRYLLTLRVYRVPKPPI